MHIDLLISMANQIGDFFAGANPEHASRDVANHLKRYWEPRMRAQIISYYEQRKGSYLTGLAHRHRRGPELVRALVLIDPGLPDWLSWTNEALEGA